VHGSAVLRMPILPARNQRRLPWAAGIAAAFLAFWGSGFFTASPGSLHDLARFAKQLVPPEIDASFLATLWEPLRQTVAISIAGTAIGIALGALLALPATATLTLWGPNDPDRPGMALRSLGRAAHAFSRASLALLRSIPEMVWVLVCVLAAGVGAFAGALALGLHTAGVLGKLYAETLEEVPAAPLHELHAAGATRLQRFAWAAFPQAREMLASYTLLRWETNLRVSTVVGMVGGGGLGLALYNAVQLGWYPRAATLIGVVWLLVGVTDALTDRLRRSPAEAPASALEVVSAASGSPAAL
jgi:phosphonate transport system permease protein